MSTEPVETSRVPAKRVMQGGKPRPVVRPPLPFGRFGQQLVEPTKQMRLDRRANAISYRSIWVQNHFNIQ